MKTDSLIAPARRWLDETPPPMRGVPGFLSWRFAVALAAVLGAFLVLVRDPFFLRDGAFCYQQGSICLLLAFVLTAALNWEMLLFGPPRGANLLLQFALCLPMSILIARITAGGVSVEPTAPASLLGTVLEFTGKAVGLLGIRELFTWIPAWVLDLFRHWQTTLIFMLTMLALSFRRKPVRISLLLLLFAVGLCGVIASGDNCAHLAGGMLLLAAALSIMYNPWEEQIYYENTLRALSVKPIDRTELRTILRAVTAARADGVLSEPSLLALVKSEYSGTFGEFSQGELKALASLITGKLLYEYRLMELVGDRDGIRLVPAPRLTRCESLLAGLAVWPRVIFTALISLLWVLLPIDLIPDGIPFVGMLDDVAVSMLSMWCFRGAARPDK